MGEPREAECPESGGAVVNLQQQDQAGEDGQPEAVVNL